jgi:hypothetical protein
MKQVVGFKWKKDTNWQPFLILANGQEGEETTRLGLWKETISIRLGRKICTGYFSSGHHFKCPGSAEVGLASTCSACKARDDWFGCIQCSGEIAGEQIVGESKGANSSAPKAPRQNTAPSIICKNPKQRAGCEQNNYWIYLAAFDGQLKVGVSYEHRFFERMIEQGADFGCRLGTVQDGGYARAVEQRVARYLGLPDKIEGAFKQSRLFGDPNASILNIAKAITKLIDGKLLDLKPETFDFRQFYKLDSVLIRPRPVQLIPGVRLVGDVIATKGNIVVMQTAAGTISFDARRLVGYEVELSSTCTSET